MVEFINVSKYNLKNLSIKIDKRDFFVICGKGGSGKTTILKLINEVILPDEGSINKNIKNDKIVLIPQEESVFNDKTVIENMLITLKKQKTTKIKRCYEILEKFRLDKYTEIKAMDLAFSYKQLLKIGMRLVGDPLLLLADEPLSNLDEEQKNLVIDALKEKHLLGTTIVLTDKIPPSFYTKLINL